MSSNLFLVVQALVVILKCKSALNLAGSIIVGVGVDDVAGEQLLPEGEASGRTWTHSLSAVSMRAIVVVIEPLDLGIDLTPV